MVKQIPYYEDSNGKPHKTQHDAWKAELTIWLIDTKAINEAQAKVLVEHITSGGRGRAIELTQIVTELSDTMPETTAARYDDTEGAPV